MLRNAAFVVPLLALLVGCVAASPQGRLVAEYRPGLVQEAKDGGTVYDMKSVIGPTSVALYRVDGEPARVLELDVDDGAFVGFQRKPGGELNAVAGNDRVPIPDGRYRWHVVPGGEPSSADVAFHHARNAKRAVGDAVGMVLMLPIMILMGGGRGWG